MQVDVRSIPRERLAELLVPINTAFGVTNSPERIERVAALPELQLLLGACEGDAIVGSTGAFTFDMTVPGGVAVETSGLTVVAVLPTHRRRGILRRMMRAHLDEAHRRGQVLAALFASEGGIYGRFGYGLAALRGEIDLRKERTAFAGGVPRIPHDGRFRLVGEAEAAAVLPAIWERVRLTRPGMLSRSGAWWRARRLADPEALRAGRTPLQRVVLETDGRPSAYALYRLGNTFTTQHADISVDIVEAMGDSPAGVRALWRYLFEIDVLASYKATQLPVDHPLLFLLAEPARMQLQLRDGLWVRLVDVGAALSRRGWREGPPLVIQVEDAFCPWNTGRYRLAGGAAERTDAAPDLALDADALGAVYLGAFGLTQLAQAGRVEELTPGALARADARFQADLAPWCPEIF
jgi:predicted acetyltransferase